LDQLIIQLCEGAALSDRQVAAAVAGLVDETIAAETKAEFLTALARKGETAAEIAAPSHNWMMSWSNTPAD